MGITLASLRSSGKTPSVNEQLIKSTRTELKLVLISTAFFIVAMFVSDVALFFKSDIICDTSVTLVGSR